MSFSMALTSSCSTFATLLLKVRNRVRMVARKRINIKQERIASKIWATVKVNPRILTQLPDSMVQSLIFFLKKQIKKSAKKNKKECRGFSDGSVVKNLPANAGDTGLIPDLGRSHMLWNYSAHVPRLLSLCSRAQEPQLLSPHAAIRETATMRSPHCSKE